MQQRSQDPILKNEANLNIHGSGLHEEQPGRTTKPQDALSQLDRIESSRRGNCEKMSASNMTNSSSLLDIHSLSRADVL